MIAAEPHLVSPIQSGPFAFRPSGERRILLPQPTRDGCVLALVGPAHRLLRAHPPGLEIASDCDQGHLQPIDPSDEGHDRGPRPQIKRELQLIRHPPHNQPPNTRSLLLIEQSPTDPPPPPLERQGPESALPIKSPPVTHCAQTRARGLGRSRLRHPPTHGLHHLTAQQLLRRRSQPPGIRSPPHARRHTILRTI